MLFIPNLLLIAGMGTSSGKTTMACRIIEQFRDLNITAIKISPHFHKTTLGLNAICEEEGYAIYEETDGETLKDTSRMLNAGASKAYYARSLDENLLFVFNKIKGLIPDGTPIICESPALRNYIEPGVFIIMTSDTKDKPKNISHLQDLPHAIFKLEELNKISSVPVIFENGSWVYRQ